MFLLPCGYWLTVLGPTGMARLKTLKLVAGHDPLTQSEQCLPVLLASLRWLETVSQLQGRKTGIKEDRSPRLSRLRRDNDVAPHLASSQVMCSV
jgi:hypothetical protein